MSLANSIRTMAIAVHNGEADPAETYAYLYNLREALEECLAAVKEVALDEVVKYGTEGYTAHGLKLTTKSAAGRWSYKGVAAHAELTAELKTIEQMAQAAHKTGAHVVRPDGVIIEPAEYTPGTTTIYATRQNQ